MDAMRRRRSGLSDPEASFALRRIFERERPDVVHAHNWLLYSLLPLHVVTKFPFVVSLHDYSIVCATKRLMRNGVCVCEGPAPVKCLTCASRRYGAVKGAAIAALAYPMGRIAEAAVESDGSSWSPGEAPSRHAQYRPPPRSSPGSGACLCRRPWLDRTPNRSRVPPARAHLPAVHPSRGDRCLRVDGCAHVSFHDRD